MWRSYLKIAYRYLAGHRAYTFINVVGLGVGMAACLLILLYVQDEVRYDRFHEQAGRIYRLTEAHLGDDGAVQLHTVLVDPPYAPLLKSAFPEVVAAARLTPVGPLLTRGDRHVDAGACYWADPDFFAVFTVPLLAGDARAALVEPFSLVLSRSKARALFGRDDVVGETVVVNTSEVFTVTGVFADLPPNTHLPVDVLGSMSSMERWFGALGWRSPNYVTYLLLAEGASAARLEAKLPAFVAAHRRPDEAAVRRLHLQPLADIHLRSHLVGELVPGGDIRSVYLFSAVALLILGIACINFTNLATARAATRAKEVGVRKAAGARRGQLVAQFLGESVLLAMLGLVLAVVLVELSLPAFNAFTGKALSLGAAAVRPWLALLGVVGVGVGVAAGGYPALFLSAFRPAVVLKGRPGRAAGRAGVRATLVVAQLVVALVLMVGTAVIYHQLAFVQRKDLGFDRAQVLVLPAPDALRRDFDAVRERLLQHPDVLGAAQSNPVPSRRLGWVQEVEATVPGRRALARLSLYPAWADAHFFPTYGIPFVAGRNFSAGEASDSVGSFILNETAVRQLGYAEAAHAVGQALRLGGHRGTLVGVVRDFHFESLHQAIAPMAFYMEPENYRAVSVRLRPGGDVAGALAAVQAVWEPYAPNRPFEYTFVDQRFAEAYAAERRMGRLFGAFAGLALVLTCLGLFGLAAFTVAQRTKEIGIRKALGASTAGILVLLSKEFARLVALAFVLAAPLAFFAMSRWLSAFAYHVGVAWWIVAGAGLAALAVTLAAVGYQSLRAARTPPVEVLRYE